MARTEDLMSSEIVTNVTSTHTVENEEHILLDCPHEHQTSLRASLSSHLKMKILAQFVWEPL